MMKENTLHNFVKRVYFYKPKPGLYLIYSIYLRLLFKTEYTYTINYPLNSFFFGWDRNEPLQAD